MSATNGTSATKRRKVSTTESTSSRSSNKDKDDQLQKQISPARTSTRIAGKERSYSHKYGYGENEAILLLGAVGKSADDEKKKATPKKSAVNHEEKEDEARPSTSTVETGAKRKYRSRNSLNTDDTKPNANNSEEHVVTASTSNQRQRKSVDESARVDGESGKVSNDLEPPQEETTTRRPSSRRSSRDEPKMPNLVANNRRPSRGERKEIKKKEEDNKIETPNEVDGPVAQEEEEAKVNNIDTNKNEVEASSSQPPSILKRKYAKRGSKQVTVTSAIAERRTTRQAITTPTTSTPKPTIIQKKVVKRKPEDSNHADATTNANDAVNKQEEDTPVKPLISKKKALGVKNESSISKVASEASKTRPSTSKPATATTSDHPSATKLLIQELKSNKDEQVVVIEELRQSRNEQQKVIDDLRKHRDLQEKLIEDLRQSRNEKQAEVDKLHAQQRASTILFHRERGEEPLSRYLSDNDMSDNEDMVSFDTSGEEHRVPSKHPLKDDSILYRIASFTTANDLMNYRLVNKQWNTQASKFLQKKGVVSLKYGVTDFMNVIPSTSNLYPMTSFKVFLTETFIKDANTEAFLQKFSNYISKLKISSEYFYTDNITLDDLRQFLPSNLPNLQDLVLQLPCKYLSKPKDIASSSDDYKPFLNGIPTKLKSLKVVCHCSAIDHDVAEFAESHFQSGLLVELLQNSPALESFKFESDKFDTNPALLNSVIQLLNSVQLPKLQHLGLQGVILQDVRVGEFLPNYQLKSLHLSAIRSEQVQRFWKQHCNSLESLTIGKVMSINNLRPALMEGFVFTNLKQLIVHSKIEDSSILSLFSKLFPKLRKLELHNPTENTLLSVWKELTQLDELVLNYFDEVDDVEKYKILHLDSLLSGFSINDCELMLKKVMKKGLPQNLDFEMVERNEEVSSIQNLRNLQKLVIKSPPKSIQFRITEVGLVLVLLRMKSLTSITISPCVLMNDTMKQLTGRISPAMHLCITPPEKGDDYEKAKKALL